MNNNFFIFILAFCVSIRSEEIPDYIKPCDIESSEFQQCAVEHANYAIPIIANGDRKVGIPSLRPLKLSEIRIEQDNFKLILKDAEVYGLENTKATRINISTKEFDGDFYIDTIQILGQYVINGKIAIVNLEGQGPANITAVGGSYHVKAPLKAYSKKNDRYLNINKPVVDIKLKKLHLDLQNLFNGDHVLGPQTNEFLNNNWQDVVDDLGAPLRETVGSIIQTIASKILGHIPISKNIIPE